MLKASFKSLFSSLVILTLFLSACTQENEAPELAANEQDISADVNVITNAVTRTFMSSTIEGGDRSNPFTVRDESSDEIYTMDERPMTRPEVRPNGGLVPCIVGTGLSAEQRMQVHRIMIANNACVATTMRIYRSAFVELHGKMEAARKDLVAKFDAGDITEEEFRRRAHALRTTYHEALQNLKRRHVGALETCTKEFLRKLNSVLDDEQWATFVECAKR